MKHRFIQLHAEGPLTPPVENRRPKRNTKSRGCIYVLSEEVTGAILKDLDSGKYTQLEVAKKYGYTRAVIRRVVRKEKSAQSIS